MAKPNHTWHGILNAYFDSLSPNKQLAKLRSALSLSFFSCQLKLKSQEETTTVFATPTAFLGFNLEPRFNRKLKKHYQFKRKKETKSFFVSKNMGKDYLYPPYSIAKKLLPWTFYAVLSLAIFRLYLYPLHLYFHSASDQLPHTKSLIITSSSTSSLSLTSSSLAQGTCSGSKCVLFSYNLYGLMF